MSNEDLSTDYSDFKARLPPCLLRPGVRRRTSEVSILAHLLYYVTKFRRSRYPWSWGRWPLMLQFSGAHCHGCRWASGCQRHLDVTLVADCWLRTPTGAPSCGGTFMSGIPFISNCSQSFWVQPGTTTGEVSPACQLLWQIWHLISSKASYLFTYRHNFPYNRLSIKTLGVKVTAPSIA